jgi:hypothetical protein
MDWTVGFSFNWVAMAMWTKWIYFNTVSTNNKPNLWLRITPQVWSIVSRQIYHFDHSTFSCHLLDGFWYYLPIQAHCQKRLNTSLWLHAPRSHAESVYLLFTFFDISVSSLHIWAIEDRSFIFSNTKVSFFTFLCKWICSLWECSWKQKGLDRLNTVPRQYNVF